jgi:hypothetical protein
MKPNFKVLVVEGAVVVAAGVVAVGWVVVAAGVVAVGWVVVGAAEVVGAVVVGAVVVGEVVVGVEGPQPTRTKPITSKINNGSRYNFFIRGLLFLNNAGSVGIWFRYFNKDSLDSNESLVRGR